MLRRKKKQRLYSHLLPMETPSTWVRPACSTEKKGATLVFGGFRMCSFLPPKQSERSQDQTRFPPKWMCWGGLGKIFTWFRSANKNDGSYTTPCLRFLAPATIRDPPVSNCESGPAPSWRVLEVFVHALFLALQIKWPNNTVSHSSTN